MASSNIKLFDENKGNMLTDTEFDISTQRLNGLQAGIASSQLQNKAMYQASLVAYAIAQVMMQNGKNANDTDAVSAFVANLSGTMLQKVYDIATTEEAQAGVATGKWMSPALVKTAFDKFWSDIYGSLVLPVSKGGTGLTSAPSLLVNLASTTAASPITASPRPGVTGTLPVARGGTGQTSLADFMNSLATSANAARIQTGSYVGTATVDNQYTSRTLTFQFAPKFLLIQERETEDGTNDGPKAWFMFPGASYANPTYSSGNQAGNAQTSWDGNSVTISGNGHKGGTPDDSRYTYDWVVWG